ncbi:hypothetical protein DAMNIGENAA_36700 [Desulforhabdus amnigena]|uniref:Uncharacterized protein n=2 Tax=Desulforhabdus amnigena TaxID=40218 RepID=A0A9W6L937_9BACT|nr:hypothetical protein DAMNIGENAA_36700 [Desulforhabdus amnigena]
MRLMALSSFLFLFLSACGYHFTGEGEGPRPGINAVAIPVFENNTSEPDLGSMFAGALRNDFIQKGEIRVVPTDQADVIFRGIIKNIYTSEVAHREFEKTILTRLYVTLDIRCDDVRNGKVLWQDPQYTYYQVYIQDPDPIIAFSNRRRALEFLAREMSIRIHDRFLSNF